MHPCCGARSRAAHLGSGPSCCSCCRGGLLQPQQPQQQRRGQKALALDLEKASRFEQMRQARSGQARFLSEICRGKKKRWNQVTSAFLLTPFLRRVIGPFAPRRTRGCCSHWRCWRGVCAGRSQATAGATKKQPRSVPQENPRNEKTFSFGSTKSKLA